MTGIEQLARKVDELEKVHRLSDGIGGLDGLSDEQLVARLLSLSDDPDAPGEGITRLSDRELSDLLVRRSITWKDIVVRATDDQIDHASRKILSKHPPEEDDTLTEEDRKIIQRARATMVWQDIRRDPGCRREQQEQEEERDGGRRP